MGNIFDCAQNPLALPDEEGAEGDPTVPAPSGRVWTLQAPTRLLDSAIWDLQRGFYDRMSVSAWSDAVVPNFVTSNRCVCAGAACAWTWCGGRVHVVLAVGRCARNRAVDTSTPLCCVA